MPAPIQWILVSGAVLTLAAFVVVLATRARRRRVVGAVLCRAPRARYWRIGLTIPAVALCVLAIGQGAPVLAPALTLLVAALGVFWLAPGEDERVCGDAGVACGWESARFDELLEWRLIGDHLRFRMGAEWRAVDLPRAAQGAVRARLEAGCAERESSFSRGSA